MKILEKLL